MTMARTDKRFSIYPDSAAVEVVGDTSPTLNLAVECWAAQLKRAMADNARDFSNHEITYTPGQSQCANALREWCFLAEAIRGRQFDPDFANPGDLLAASVEDAHRLYSLGRKWFTSVLDDFGEREEKSVEQLVERLVAKLRELDYPHAWAVILAVRWYWENQDRVDFENDEWWTLALRRHHVPTKPKTQKKEIEK